MISIDEQLDLARQEGVRTPENLPFLLAPDMEPKGSLLLVHGFSASPYETSFFGRLAAAAGFYAMGVRLPGHGSFPEELLTRRYEEWLESVADGYDLLAKRGLPVYGIGVSTGALLLLGLGPSRPFHGLSLLSPFLTMRHRLASSTGILKIFHRMYKSPVPHELAPYYYSRRAMNGIHQVHRLARRTAKNLGMVKTPCLVIGAEGDRTIRLNSTIALFRRLGSLRKELHLYGPETPHVLSTPENPHWRQTFRLVTAFFEESDFSRTTAASTVQKFH